MTDWGALLREDPAAFARELRRRADEGVRVAAARPGFPAVGGALITLHAAFTDSLWGVHSLTNDRRPHVLKPRSGAPGDNWDRGSVNVNPENSLVLEVVDGYATAVRDHLLGFAHLALAEGPARPMLALARVLLDASVHLSFLVTPAIDERERCARALNVRFEALRQEIADGREASVKIEEDRAGLMRDALKDGYERETADSKTQKRKPTWFVLPRHRSDDVLKEAVGGPHQDSWRTLSSVVHAQERSTVRFALGLDSVHPGPHASATVMTHAGIPIALATEAIRMAESFYNGSRSPVVDEAANDVQRVVMAATGQYDDIIRTELGIESN
ncbi:hypothetical protein [Georgenia yuyongxinii]|uniref:Uncharacterized protein n=1 Tax=Georgenia yuyongxinii TaxID=2589797 RepID=A0A552WNP0_9MICO|nr:hypothetical protein [Georgenia yuyongxinii]TRW44386.1 hypothetical protein FJ693_13735 [Georgenia yuyongxinii]